MLLTLDNPDMRNAMSDEMTSSWVAAIDELAADPSAARGGRDGGGQRLLLGRQHVVDRQRARRERRPAPLADAAVLPGLALDPAPRGADHRGGQRGRHRRRALPRARLRHPLRRERREARPALQQARHARRHGRHVAAAQRRRRRRTPATCCSPAASSRPTRRCAWAWSRGCIERDGFLDEVLATAAGIAATAPIASRLTKIALADGGHADFESALQWEALAQPMTWRPPTSRRGSRGREKRRRVRGR